MKLQFLIAIFLATAFITQAQRKYQSFSPGSLWEDNTATHINAHGGGILYHNGTYYWFGEHKSENSNDALVGITCYSSVDLYNWNNRGVALPVVTNNPASDITKGCIMERPKVIYNKKTNKFVMYFHLELKGQGYDAARVGIAVADNVTGPYIYKGSSRPNAKHYPLNFDPKKTYSFDTALRRDYDTGQKSRDMTLFVDDNEKAYHIFSSEDNATLHIALLSDDYQSHTGEYVRMAPGGYNEAPAIFKRNGKYFMFASGCTGWAPNAARLFSADHIYGPWKEYPNPCIGANADLTFYSQSTYVLPVVGRENDFIFMADRWTPDEPINGRYVWLPIHFENGLPTLRWVDEWDLSVFDKSMKDLELDIVNAKKLLLQAKIGNEIGSYPQAAYNTFSRLLKEIESAPSMSDILRLSEAVKTFSDTKIPPTQVQLQDGNYHILCNGFYLTNEGGSHPAMRTGLLRNGLSQVFSIQKLEETGRYKIVSQHDGRSLNEYVELRDTWGDEDHLWRSVNFYSDGNRYAIMNDGNSRSFGAWTVNGHRFGATDSLLLNPESDFIFTLHKVDD